jgi:hypothetical protein
MTAPVLFLLLALAPTPTPCAPSEGGAAIALAAGTRLREAPDPSARSVAVLDADVELPVLSRCGVWAEVRWEGYRCWARPGDVAGPSLERAPRSADDARLAKVRTAMKPLGREVRLGPWRVLTDVASGELAALEPVATKLPAAFAARYGAEAAPGEAQAVAIFASDARYRRFAKDDGSPMLGTRGHAGGGLAAFAMGRTPLESRVTLVHELAHLLSRNAFGESLPAWLDEGMAEDLAWCRVDAEGRLVPGTFDVTEIARGTNARERSGPLVTAESWTAQARSGRVTSLPALLDLEGRLFANTSARRDAASESAMLVRWCLATKDRADRFREFLRVVALGGAGDASGLSAALGTDVNTLSKEFFEWAKSRAAGL